jgi:hypothetical protein
LCLHDRLSHHTGNEAGEDDAGQHREDKCGSDCAAGIGFGTTSNNDSVTSSYQPLKYSVVLSGATDC